MKKRNRDDCTFVLAWLYLLTFVAVPVLLFLRDLIFGR